MAATTVAAPGASTPRGEHPMQPRLAFAIGIVLIVALLASRLIPPLAFVVSLPFLYMLVRKPVLRRLAIGHISRRPRETFLVILGALLGTAIITGSFVLGDTLRSSIVHTAFTQLGPIDELVSAVDPATAAKMDDALQALPKSDVDGVLPINVLTVTAASTGANVKAEPRASLVETDFARAATFGGDAKATGITGATPAPGAAAIGADLAKRLEVKAGDHVDLYAYGTKIALTVDRVLPRVGVAGFGFGSGSAAPTIFAAPGTVATLAGSGTAKGATANYFVAVSNIGGVLKGADGTVKATEDVKKILGDTTNVGDAKRGLIKAAKQQSDGFSQIFRFMGFFSAFAGILLLVNIFVMLAQERQSEFGMLRAVGLRRSGLVGAFSLEGWMYALGAAGFGTLGGLLLGRIIVVVAAGIFSRGFGTQGGLELVYSANRSSGYVGFLFGFITSMITVLLTSIWISRLNVIRAIRELPKPKTNHQAAGWFALGLFLTAIGTLMTLSGFGAHKAVPVLVGPLFLAMGLTFILWRWIRHETVLTVASASLVLWEIFAFAIVRRAFRDVEIIVFVIQGLILVGSAVVLISSNQQTVGRIIKFAGGGAKNTSLRIGLAYPLARVGRTALVLATYALVVYILVTITIFSHIFGSQLDSFSKIVSGGFDGVVESNASNPVPVDAMRQQPGVRRVAAISQLYGEFKSPISDGFIGWPAASFDESYIAERAPKLSQRPSKYKSDIEVYRDVLANPDIFVPTAFFLQTGGGPPKQVHPGDQVTLRDPQSGRSKVLTVAAVAESGFGNLRPLMSAATLKEVFGEKAVANVLYINVKPGENVDKVTGQINGTFLANGADAHSFHQVIAQNLSSQQRVFGLMRGYLAIGLLIGIASLGVVMVRAVRERRREIGVLRALGFESKAIRRAFVAEAAFVSAEGLAIGMALAIVTTWRLVGNANFGAQLHFSIPFVSLIVLFAGATVASLIATGIPAEQASRIKPAVALRIAD